MSKEGEVETATGRLAQALRDPKANYTVECQRELELMYDVGYNAGQLATDAKLDESLKALQRNTETMLVANEKMRSIAAEREIFLVQFTRQAWGEAIKGMLASGFHPPSIHRDPRYTPRVGKVACTRCKPEIKVWEAMTDAEKADRTRRTYASTMQAFAKAKLAADKPALPDGPTTHELGGVAKPTPIPPIPPQTPTPKWELLTAKDIPPQRGVWAEGPCQKDTQHRGTECKCTHLVAHCCDYHCCCFKPKPVDCKHDPMHTPEGLICEKCGVKLPAV